MGLPDFVALLHFVWITRIRPVDAVLLKGELGLDHYEGRRFPGWHHHVSVALCCYAFIVAERVRRFPLGPRDGSSPRAVPLGLSATSTTASFPRGSPWLG